MKALQDHPISGTEKNTQEKVNTMEMDNSNQKEIELLEEHSKSFFDATIMMVDDESITMEVAKAFLEDEGYYNFILVEHSSQAMGIIEESPPDILLLDLVMPEVDGFTILTEIRKVDKFKHLPVIILTSSSETESKLRALGLGATDFLAKPVDPSELSLRVRNTLAAKAYIDQLAYTDPLTKLANRAMFIKHLTLAIKKGKRDRNKMAVLNIGLDKNFNKINAAVGMKAGDAVLYEIARRIEQMTRQSDVLSRYGTGDLTEISLFRLEGSAFSLLLENIHSVNNAAQVAKRILNAIKKPLLVEGTAFHITTSIGIAMFPSESDNLADLLRLAASARDYAKSMGGDSFQFSSQEINTLYTKKLQMENDLRLALENNELEMYYQPKVETHSGSLHGVEALLRWKRADGTCTSPAEFIPLAEETGLIVPIGEWVLEETCRQMTRWHKTGNTILSISVNVSTLQFKDINFLKSLELFLKKYEVNTEYLTIELTESLLMDDVDKNVLLLKHLKSLGVKLSIDDFGTGYSSLSYLRDLPVDELKIDQSFIKNSCMDEGSRAIVSSVIYLARSLGLTTVAEGVETEEQLTMLRKEDCTQCQGYFFGYPVPADQIDAMIA